MIIECPNCKARYEVGPAQSLSGRKVRCSQCQVIWHPGADAGAEPERPQAAPTPASPIPQESPAPSPFESRSHYAPPNAPSGGANPDTAPAVDPSGVRWSAAGEPSGGGLPDGPAASEAGHDAMAHNSYPAPADFSGPAGHDTIRGHGANPTGPPAGDMRRGIPGDDYAPSDGAFNRPDPYAGQGGHADYNGPVGPAGHRPHYDRAGPEPRFEAGFQPGSLDDFASLPPPPLSGGPRQAPPGDLGPGLAPVGEAFSNNYGPPNHAGEVESSLEPQPGMVEGDGFDPAQQGFASDFDDGVRHEPVTGPGKRPGRRRSRPAGSRGRVGVLVGWIILLAGVAGLVGVFLLRPATVVARLPGTLALYKSIGRPVNVTGLALRDIAYQWVSNQAPSTIRVQGMIDNVTSHDVNIPPIVFVILDGNGREVFKWAKRVRIEPLPGGETTFFSALVPAPISLVRGLRIEFAKGGRGRNGGQRS